jgi:hypothetical protein
MSIFRKGIKYYIIAYNTYYEGVFKKEFDVYGNKAYTFRTRVGDLHLIENQTFFGTPHLICNYKEDMLMELGVRVYRGVDIKRTPYSHHKHIQYVFNKAPEKLI